jgi:hypothetical protein
MTVDHDELIIAKFIIKLRQHSVKHNVYPCLTEEQLYTVYDELKQISVDPLCMRDTRFLPFSWVSIDGTKFSDIAFKGLKGGIGELAAVTAINYIYKQLKIRETYKLIFNNMYKQTHGCDAEIHGYAKPYSVQIKTRRSSDMYDVLQIHDDWVKDITNCDRLLVIDITNSVIIQIESPVIIQLLDVSPRANKWTSITLLEAQHHPITQKYPHRFINQSFDLYTQDHLDQLLQSITSFSDNLNR